MEVATTLRGFFLFTLVSIAGLGSAAAGSWLDARVEPVSTTQAAGTGQVRYTLSNSGATAILVLRWQTALEGVQDDLFDVRRDGVRVDYVGRHYKRGLPQPEDYIEIAAGESKSVVVDLTTYYDMRLEGSYEVRVDTQLMDALREDPTDPKKLVDIEPTALESAPVYVWVDGAHVTLEPDLPLLDAATANSVSFVGCSNTRQASISTAVGSARSYAGNASSYLGAGLRGSRYSSWFGSYTSARFTTVRSHFTRIANALGNKPLVFDCSCTDPYYAYVYPSQPYRIYLCNAFWSAPDTGTDSRAGTIIHETSHFAIVASTDDWAYGQAAARNLARSNPAQAIDNADSHEYFAENNPAQN